MGGYFRTNLCILNWLPLSSSFKYEQSIQQLAFSDSKMFYKKATKLRKLNSVTIMSTCQRVNMSGVAAISHSERSQDGCQYLCESYTCY